MTEIIAEDLIQQRIDKYVEENQEQIIEMIDKKIATKVKEAVSDVFRYRNRWEETPAAKVIDGKIKQAIAVHAESISIDNDWIESQINKKVRSTVKNLKITIDN